jgi:hypothetical protein
VDSDAHILEDETLPFETDSEKEEDDRTETEID